MDPTSRDIEEFLIEQLAERRGEDITDVKNAVLAAGTIDSIEGVELILAAEETYGVDIPDDALAPEICSSLSELAGLILSKMVR